MAQFPSIKGTFRSADLAKRTRAVIFNAGGNKYRLVAEVNFDKQEVLIRQVLTYKEYEREKL